MLGRMSAEWRLGTVGGGVGVAVVLGTAVDRRVLRTGTS